MLTTLQTAVGEAELSEKEAEEEEEMALFRAAVHSKYTRDHYERHFKYFLDFVGKLSPKELKQKAKSDPKWCEDQVLRYILSLRQRVDKKEIAASSTSNYVKPLKLFLEMNDIALNWKKIYRLLPKGKTFADDRAPTKEEIIRLVAYPDRRIKPLVLMLASSGMRLGAFEYLNWGDIEPISLESGSSSSSSSITAAKVTVYRGEPEQYFTYITPEAYHFLKEYIDFRASWGEKITPSSPVFRDLFKGDLRGKGEPHVPKRLKPTGISRLIQDALKTQGLRTKLEDGKRRYEFKADHGFRKFHWSNCETAGLSREVILQLQGDTSGLGKNYSRHSPQEHFLLDKYIKAIPHLTILEDEAASKNRTGEDSTARTLALEAKEDVEVLKKQMIELESTVVDLMRSFNEQLFRNLLNEFYSAKGMERVRRMKRLKELGFNTNTKTLEEIELIHKKLKKVAVKDFGRNKKAHAEYQRLLKLYDQKIKEIMKAFYETNEIWIHVADKHLPVYQERSKEP
jgi:hypothetical protein